MSSARYFLTYPSVALVIDKFGCEPDNWAGVACPNATQVLRNFIAEDPLAGSLCSESSSCSGESAHDDLPAGEDGSAVFLPPKAAGLPASAAADETFFFTPLSDSNNQPEPDPAMESEASESTSDHQTGGDAAEGLPVLPTQAETPEYIAGQTVEVRPGGPVEEPAEEPAGEPAAEPAEEPAEEPAGEPAAEPAAEPAEEPAEEPATILKVEVGRDEPHSASSCLIEPSEEWTALSRKAVTLVPRAPTSGYGSDGALPSNKEPSQAKRLVSLRPHSSRRNGGSSSNSRSASNSRSRKILVVKGTETL